MSSSACFIAYALPVAGPALAWIYALTVHIFLSAFGEIDFFCCNKINALLLRTALLGASIAIGAGLCEASSKNGKNDTVVLWAAVLPVTIILQILSTYLIIQTRRNDVAGPKPVDSSGSRTSSNISMQGKVVLVTGANTGIGKQTVQQLAALGATVILGCRNEQKASQAIQDITTAIEKEKGMTLRPDQLRFLKIDLASFDSIRTAARTFLDGDDWKRLPLHILINNAGVMFSTKTMSKDGFEMCLQANHLGHFLLTNLLLPKLLKVPDARIINLTSITYKMAKRGFDFDDMNCNDHPYTLFGQYAQSKLANVLFTKELAKRYGSSNNNDGTNKLTAYAVNPGIVRTDVTRNMSFLLRYGNELFGFLVALLQKTPAQGAYTSVFAATTGITAASTEDGDASTSTSSIPRPPNGSFLSNSKAEQTNDYVNNHPEDATRLWQVSKKLVGLLVLSNNTTTTTPAASKKL